MFRRGSTFREVLEMIVLTIAIFLVVRVALQNFRVEGDSMNPTLQDAEYILVNKVDYFLHSPQRGDIVVFHATPAGQPDKDFIKRIVGLPGDTVQVKNGGVYINGRLLPETSYKHTIPDYNWGPAKVPPSDYFVLGDNRNNSEDSHLWRWLPRSDIIGKAWISYWPLDQLHLFQAALTPPLD